MIHNLATDFGLIPVRGFVHRRDLGALERCSKRWAQDQWQSGVDNLEPLTVEVAMKMPEWQEPEVGGYNYPWPVLARMAAVKEGKTT